MFKQLFSLFLLCCVLTAQACGPTPQKISKEIEIHASPEAIQAVIDNHTLIQDWHPLVNHAAMTIQKESGQPVRSISLTNNWTLSETIRDTSDGRYLEKTFMESGTMPVTQLKSVLQVLPSDQPGVTKLRWLGRFFNKANLLDAPEGKDNATAIAAVTLFYEQGLSGLKAFLENTKTINPLDNTLGD